MKTNAVIRIILFGLAILILLGILLAGLNSSYIWDMYRFEKRNDQAESVSPDRVDYTQPPIIDDSSIGEPTADSPGTDGPSANEPAAASPTDPTVSASEADYFFSVDRISEIEIEWAAGNILIQSADVDQILIQDLDSGSRYRTHIEQEEDGLSIEFSDEDFHFPGISFGQDFSKDLVIMVPRDWVCRELSIDAASARVEVRDLTIGEVDFDGASGECLLTNCSVRLLNVDTASGDVRFTGELNQLDFDAASASFYGDLTNVPYRMEMDSASGGMELILPKSAGFRVTLDALSKDFTTDFPTTSQGGAYLCGDGSCMIQVSCMSGDVAIYQCQNQDHPGCA